MEDEIFVQSVAITMKLPTGKVVTGKFTGLAICSKAEWDELKKKDLGQALAGNSPILFTDPKPIESVLSGENKHGIVDSIRQELKSDHHNELSD